MQRIARPLHRLLSPWLVLPLFVSAATGMAYRFGRTWFGIEKPVGARILEFHTGAAFGEIYETAFMAVSGLGLLALTVSGGWLLWRSRAKQGARRWHRVAAWGMLPPLLATSVTGLGYHFGEAWFGFEKDTLKLLMNIHQGSWLGPKLRAFYILLVGGGLLTLMGTGVALLMKKGGAKSEAPAKA